MPARALAFSDELTGAAIYIQCCTIAAISGSDAPEFEANSL
jgi:hypothetical protein